MPKYDDTDLELVGHDRDTPMLGESPVSAPVSPEEDEDDEDDELLVAAVVADVETEEVGTGVGVACSASYWD